MTTWEDEHGDFAPFFDELDLGELIRELRRRERLRQFDLAERLRVSQSLIARYERGRRRPTVRTLARIALATGHDLTIRFASREGIAEQTFRGAALAYREQRLREAASLQRSADRIRVFVPPVPGEMDAQDPRAGLPRHLWPPHPLDD